MEKDVEIRAFLNYIKNNKSTDDLTKKIDITIKMIKQIEENKEAYMIEHLKIRDKIMEGKKEGRNEQKIEDAKNFYKNGCSVELIAKSLNLTEKRVLKIINSPSQ